MTNHETAPRYCTGCGKPLDIDARFCANCGTPVMPVVPIQSSLNPQPGQGKMPQAFSATPSGEPKKQNKRFPVLTAVILCVLVVSVGLLAIFLFSGKEDRSDGTSLGRREDSGEVTEKDDPDISHSIDLAPGTYKVGVAIYQYNDNFMTLYRQEIAAYFQTLETDDVRFDIFFVDGKNDVTEQSAQIDAFISQGMDVIICNLVQPSYADVIIDKVVAADIPLILINREPVAYDWDGNILAEAYEGILNNPRVCYVGTDTRQAGTLQGQIVVNLPDHGDINGDGVVKYVMIEGDPENIAAQYRTEFSIKALMDAGIEVECLVDQIGNWEESRGQEIAAAALAQYGTDIEVIFCNNDGMALGAAAAIEAAGRKVGEDIYLVGVDALDDAVERIGNGTMTGTVLNDHIGQSHTAVDLAVKLLNGETVENYYWVDYIIVDRAYVSAKG